MTLFENAKLSTATLARCGVNMEIELSSINVMN